jgi:cytoskeleton protein RodZ
MEGLGKKLKEARLARGLTLDEAGRQTKIRPTQLNDIENEDFSQFASLAYAKGFLVIYGRFLEVDVTPYLEAFETSETLTVDGYSYLQDAPEPEPARPVVVRRRSSSSGGGGGGGRGGLIPLIIGILVLVIGFTVMKWFFQMQRLKPRPTPAPGSSPVATATASDRIVAPRAQPADTTAPPPASPTPALPTPTATTAATTPVVPAPPPAEPEVRRAEPVHAEDAAQIPTPTPSPKRSPRPPRPSPSPRASPIASPRAR